MVGKTLGCVLRLRSCFGKTYVESWSRAAGFIKSVTHMVHKLVMLTAKDGKLRCNEFVSQAWIYPGYVD